MYHAIWVTQTPKEKNPTYSEILNKSTGTIEKKPPKYLAVRTFFAVLLAIIQEFEMLY